jgi:hypothetical protein
MSAFLLEEPYDEEGPDGNNYNPNSTQPVRRFQWWGWLGTIGGYIAGNGFVWQFVDPTWQQHLDTQGAQDMARLNAFINSLEWWTLIPEGLNGMENLVVNNVADTSASYIAAAATRTGSMLVAYAPPPYKGDIVIDMTSIKRTLNAYWFDPTNGKYISVKGDQLERTDQLSFSVPGPNSRNENDWVLLMTEDKKIPDSPATYESRTELVIAEANMYIRMPNAEWQLTNGPDGKIVQYIFKRSAIKDSDGRQIIAAIIVYVEDATKYKQDVTLYSIEKRMQFQGRGIKVEKVYIHENKDYPLTYKNGYLTTCSYTDSNGLDHILHMIHIINKDNIGIQVYMDMTKSIAAEYEKEFWITMRSLEEIK